MRHAIALFVLWLCAACAHAMPATQIGVISYWGSNAALYDPLPAGSLALVNPDNGIFVSAGQSVLLTAGRRTPASTRT